MSESKIGEPGKRYRCGPGGEAIEVDPETPYKGPDSLVKKLAWGGQPLDAVAHMVGKMLTNHDIAAHLGDNKNVYLGNIRGHKVEDGAGAVLFIIDGKFLGNDGEISICSGSIRVQFTQREEQPNIAERFELDISHLPWKEGMR